MYLTCLFPEILPDSYRKIISNGQIFKLFGHMILMQKEAPANLVDSFL